MTTNDDFMKMVRECLNDDSDRLSEWEQNFLDDIFRRNASQPVVLSDRQRSVIQKIWAKLFGGSA